jgi:oligopeptide transport system permease protein
MWLSITLRFATNLLLIPLTAFLVYQAITSIPFQADTDAKQESLSSVSRQMRDDLGIGQPFGFLRPWEKLYRGERLGDGPRAYTGKEISTAIYGSVRVGFVGFLLALFWGCSFSLLRALWRNHTLKTALELLPVFIYGTPTFIVALFGAMLFGVPMPGEASAFEWLMSLLISLVPGIFLGSILSDALEVETKKQYVIAARARGNSQLRTIIKHALPNAMPALLDALPPVATSLLAGSFIVEKLFHVSYFGLLYIDAVQTRQLALVVVATTLFAALLVLVSLSTDLLRVWLDPRAREPRQ